MIENKAILAARSEMKKKFTNKGVILGIISGLTFGIFGVIVGLGVGYSPLQEVSAAAETLGYAGVGIAGIIIVPIIAAAITDITAAFWLLGYNTIKGKNRELLRTIKTRPGIMIVCGALAGGPIANAAYLIAIILAGSTYAIPISALCPMVGALLARLLFKQEIIRRVAAGMALCIAGAIIISYTPPEGSQSLFYLGVVCAVIAAVGWGVEGAFSSFGGSVLDPDVAINIRQIVSGLVFLVVLVPVLGGTGLMLQTLQTPIIVAIIALAGFSAAVSFLTWYQANSMVGCATGMALNITYVFWGCFFAMILDPVNNPVTVTVVVGGIVLMLGALIVSVNPLDLFKSKKTQEQTEAGVAP